MGVKLLPRPKYKWPEYVEGILSPEQIKEVELQDSFFRR